MKAISGFDPVFNQKSILCGWIGGHEAEFMETLTDSQVANACVDVLKKFTGNQKIPAPVRIYRYVVLPNLFLIK